MKKKLDFILQVCFFCHKRPDRSFFYKGKQFPLCARCTGLAVGYVLSLFIVIIIGLIPWYLIGIFILPMVIDGTGQLFNKWTSTNLRRLITGILGGISIMYIIYYIGYTFFLFGRYMAAGW